MEFTNSIFDVFDSPSNFNALLLGQSGSGKSFLMGLLSSNYFKKGYDVILFDSGYSHVKLGKILGRHIDFTLDKPISVNPFALIKNKCDLDEHLDGLRHFICGIANINIDSEKYRYYAVHIEQSIIELWNVYKDKLELSHFANKFKTSDDLIELGKAIEIFDIKYGDFFKSESKIDFNGYTVIETSNLDDSPLLRDAVISALYIHIFNKISDKNSKRTVCFMDEYQKYLNSDFILSAIEPVFCRFRAHNASVIVSIQSFNDIFLNNNGINRGNISIQGLDDVFLSNGKISRQGRVLLNNSAYKIFLRQSDESWNYINNFYGQSADLNRIGMYSSVLHSEYEKYSEAVVYYPFKDDHPVFPSDIKILKIKPETKFEYYLLSSLMSDNVKINKYLPEVTNIKNAAGTDIANAINEVVKNTENV
jgi:conjugal transfer ATP-binding protein TraC